MAPRSSIIAGKSVIVVQVEDLTNTAFNSIEKNLKKFSTRISRIGFELFSGGLFGSFGTAFLAKQFKDFEDELLFLKTKLQPTDAEFTAITETIRKLGRTTSFTAKQVAEAATVLAQAGFKAAEVQQLLLPTLDLAKANQIELSAAGEILANTLRSFSLDASKAGEVASQFTAAARLGTLDVLNLKESIKEVLGTARQLNIDLPTTLALITQLAERSLKGTKAGTSLNTALLNLASKGKQLKQLGLVLPNNINGDDFIKFLGQLKTRISGLGNLKQVAILQQLFNIRGARAITALDDLAKVLEIQKEIRNAGNEARRTAEIMDSGFGGAVRRATSSLESFGLTLGNILAKGITPMIKQLPTLFAGFEQLAKVNEQLTLGLVLTPPALLAVGAGMLVTGFAVSKLAALVGTLGFGVRTVGGLISKVLITNLTTLAIVTDRSRKALKGLDQGLSAALLPAILTGGRGRNAKKPKKTSFIGRIGNFNLSPAGIIKTTVLLESAILKLISLTGTFLTSLPRLIGQGAGLMAIALTKYVTIVNKIDDLFSKKASFTFFDLQNIFKGKFKNPFAGISTLFAGVKLRNPIILFQKLASVIERSFVAVRAFQKVLFFTFSSGTGKSLFKVGNAIAAFIEKIQFGKGISTLASVGIKGFFSALRGLTTGSFSIVKGLFNIFSFTGKIALGFLRAANAVRRFAFSFSGVLTIIELLIIFGPKIDFIRQAFERLGKGISKAFESIGTIAVDILPAFELFGLGFSKIFKGDAEKGLGFIIESLGFMVDIVRIRLVAAWNDLQLAIAPAVDFMGKMIQSTIELGKLFGSLFGTTLGAGFVGIGDAIQQGFTGGQSLSDIINNVFTAENMKAAFSGIGTFFTGIAETIRNAVSLVVHSVVDTMILLKTAIISVLPVIKTLLTATGNGDKNDLIAASLRLNPVTNFLAPLFGKKATEDSTAKAMADSTDKMKASLDKFDKAFEQAPNRIQNAFEEFSKRLETIFKGNRENSVLKNQSKNEMENLAADLELQAALAEARGKRRGLTNRSLFDKSVNVLGSFNSGQPLTKNQRSILEKQDKLRRFGILPELPKDGRKTEAQKAREALESQIRKSNREFAKSDIRSKIKNRFRGINPIQQATLADVAASTIGTFQQTRNNKFGVGTRKDIATQQLDALNTIQTNTGGANDALQDLAKRANPFVFQ